MSLHNSRTMGSRASAPKEYYYTISPTSRRLRKDSYSHSGHHRSSSFNLGVRQIIKTYSPFHKRQRGKTKENTPHVVVRNTFYLSKLDYLKTLFASHNAQNGTNMHFLSLGNFNYFTFIILIDFILR